MEPLDERLIAEAVAYLDEILNAHAFAFVALDKGQLVQRLDSVRASAIAARYVLTERRSLAVE